MINKTLSQFEIPQFPNRLELKSLKIGSSPPVLEIMKIQEFSLNRLQLQVKFQYNGHLELNLNSKLEINALNLIDFDTFTKPHFVMSNKSLVLPVDFSLSEFQIDSNMTFILLKRINKLVLIFNEDPIIDFNLKTSMDDLLDDDVLQELREDTLKMCLGFVKNELPLIISGYSVFEGMDEVHDIEIEDHTKDNTILEHTSIGLDNVFGTFNTLSLIPSSFEDVCERIHVKETNQDQEVEDIFSISRGPSPKKERVRRRRIIKIKRNQKLSEEESSCPQSLSPPTLQVSAINSPTLVDSSVDMNSLDEYGNDTLLSMHDFNTSNDLLGLRPPSAPLNDSNNIFNSAAGSSSFHSKSNAHSNNNDTINDPYENLLHPLDILPSFQDLTDSLNEEFFNESMNSVTSSADTSCIVEYDTISDHLEYGKKSNRRASSNYINLNEFKRNFTKK
jgi:hypothetical protein